MELKITWNLLNLKFIANNLAGFFNYIYVFSFIFSLKKSYLQNVSLKFFQELFDLLDIPDLLINIWDCADHAYHEKKKCPCKKYLEFCEEATAKKWSNSYVNFAWIIRNLKLYNRCFADFGKISTENENIIYIIIAKDC